MTSDARSAGLLFVGGTLLVTAIGILLGEQWLKQVIILQSGPFGSLPAPDIRADYLTGVFWAVILGVGVMFWGAMIRFQRPLVIVWAAKSFVALGPMLLYDFTYGVDPDGYYLNASSLGFSWQGLTLGQGTKNIQMLTWLHLRLLSSSFHATRLTFAFTGLVTAYLVYRAGALSTGREDRRLFYVFALMPSVLFWSSILGKDPIALFGVGVYTYGVVAWQKLRKARYLLWVAAGLTIAIYVRTWFGPILLIPLGVLGALRTNSFTQRMLFVTLGLAGVLAAPVVLQQTIGIDAQQDQILESTDRLSRIFPAGGSSQEVPDLATPGDIARFAPSGLFTAFFRPLPGEVTNLFGILAGIENALVLALAVRAIWRTKWRELREPLVAWAMATVLLWGAVYSIVSFQNLGTLSRYRLQITPLFLGLLFYLGRRRTQLSPQGVRVLATAPRPFALRQTI